MAARIEIEEFVTPERLEYAHGLAMQNMARRRESFAATGWRAARAKDPKMLLVLEKGAEILDKMTDSQHGRTMRSQSATHGETKGTTEAQLWKNAYTTMDNGSPEENYSWIYGAAAFLCGYGG
jgi:endo-alpha-1,4-polygalactosaminidase (GH114 family)